MNKISVLFASILIVALLAPFPIPADAQDYHTRSGGLDFSLGSEGLQAGGLAWGIRLSGFGRGDQVAAIAEGEATQADGRLEFRHAGLTEWYRDMGIGMEQGFTISEAPKGNGRLVLHLDLSTDLEGRLNDNERGISFAVTDELTLRYDNLKAYDANGAELDAKMAYNPAQVVIQVDDREAAYPITIDPLIGLEQKVVVMDGAAGDNLGYSVAMDGDTAVIGAANDDINANTDQGSAYVFTRIGTTWVQQAKLTASDGAASDYFGCSVAVSGDTVLVGARNSDVGTNADQGAAYVFVRSGTTWTQQAKLTASEGEASDVFGWSVALSGDTALVGAQWDDIGVNGDQDRGSAYVFTRSGGTWTQQEHLYSPYGAAGDNLGFSVALSGDTALIGAPNDDVGVNGDQGSVYVFTRSGTIWYMPQVIINEYGISNDRSGASVALSGDTTVIGSPGSSLGAAGGGCVEFYQRNGTTWNWITAVVGSSAGIQMGSSVALSDNIALVGAANYEGVATLARIGSSWGFQYSLTASDGISFAGSSVAISGDMGLVGAPFATVGANTNQGSAYFYQVYRPDADLAVSAVTGSGSTLYNGDTVYLTASVTNYGPSSTDKTFINVSLPAGLTYVSHIATLGTYSPSSKSWYMANLPLGVTASLVIQATVDMISTPTNTLTFSANSIFRDVNDANNSASLTLTVKKKEQAKNGGFNTYAGVSKIPQYWTAANFASTDGKDTTATNRKEGTASVKISNTTAKTKTLTQTLSTLAGSAGDSFIFSYWVKGNTLPAAGLCQAQVIFYNGAVAVGTPKTLACGSTGTFAYKQRKLSFIAPGDYTKVIIKFTYSKASGTVWFDLVSLLR